MPVLHHYQNRDGAYVKAWIQGSIVTLQLTGRGLERLTEGGVHDGTKFPLKWLVDLIHDREAFTNEGSAAVKTTRHEAEQFVFNFAEDEEAQRALPVCEQTGSFEDLHLVVHGDPPHAQLLGPAARKLAGNVSLSIPLNLVAAKDLDRLIASGKLPESAPCVAHLRAFFSRERAGRWEALTGRRQQQAQLDLEGEFRLR